MGHWDVILFVPPGWRQSIWQSVNYHRQRRWLAVNCTWKVQVARYLILEQAPLPLFFFTFLFLGVLSEFALEDSVAILWTKHRLILTLVERVREFLESLAHLDLLGCFAPSREVHLMPFNGRTG